LRQRKIFSPGTVNGTDKTKGTVMDHSKHRLEHFSDIIIAISMTVLVFEIPVPRDFNFAGIINTLLSIRIFLVTFIVMGSFWNRHHRLVDRLEKITNKIIWRNLIFLFSLTLIPLSSRWIIANPKAIVGYDVIFLLVNITYFFMFKGIYGKNKAGESAEIKYIVKFNTIFLFINGIMTILLVIFDFLFPNIPKIIYLLFPVISSRINLFLKSRKYKKIKQRRELTAADATPAVNPLNP
jgi:uncharacterized membrane protein